MDIRPFADAPAAGPAAVSWAAPGQWRVLANRRETRDVVTLELQPPGGEAFAFAAGQFNMVAAPGVGEVPVSISGDPGVRSPVLHTIRNVGAATGALCRLAAGATVTVRGPYGTPWPVEEAQGHDVLIVAGGIGLAPLRPAIHHVLANRERYGRVAVLYGARTPADLLFRRQLGGWRARFDIQLEVTVDAAEGGWKGSVGVVPGLIPRAQVEPARTLAFVVGPEIMMRFAIKALGGAGVAEDAIFLSLERNMQCGVGLCGHCQLGPFFVCRDGPVLAYERVEPWFRTREM